jgi:phosphoribosylglycinamide formyltransferase 1
MPSGDKTHIAIFASGGGSNADKICSYFKFHPEISISLIVTNRADAGALKVADRHGVESVYISKKYWAHPEIILPVLESSGITHIVLAGFLSLVPDWLIRAYSHRIINIHPALLPRHGGKGMYGHYVHEAVKSSGELVSGITIHEVNERYDDGKIIFQQEVQLDATDSAEEIAQKVLQAEHTHYPKVIEAWIHGESDSAAK